MNEKKLEEWKRKRLNRKKSLDHDQLLKGILAGNIQALSSSITLLESAHTSDQKIARDIVNSCIPHAGKSVRVGVTGVPGVGKSTFIESFGQFVVSKGHKIAVLAIDPSSERSGGSILGDKTRMQQLSQSKKAFIRPSAAGKSLGGVARKTREAIILCEAAGFDYILIETVGVGQSETVVHSMVDFFLLLMLAGAGDELQGIKRGIMEMADALVITKADGDNVLNAKKARVQYKNALHLFPPSKNQWIPKVLIASAYENFNIDGIFDVIDSFHNHTSINGSFEHKRMEQDKYWLHETIADALMVSFYGDEDIQAEIKSIEEDIKNRRISSFHGAEKLLSIYQDKQRRK